MSAFVVRAKLGAEFVIEFDSFVEEIDGVGNLLLLK
jgi:hypothetical protein